MTSFDVMCVGECQIVRRTGSSKIWDHIQYFQTKYFEKISQNKNCKDATSCRSVNLHGATTSAIFFWVRLLRSCCSTNLRWPLERVKAQRWSDRHIQQQSWAVDWSALKTKYDSGQSLDSSWIFLYVLQLNWLCQRSCYVLLHLVAFSNVLLLTGVVDSGHKPSSQFPSRWDSYVSYTQFVFELSSAC